MNRRPFLAAAAATALGLASAPRPAAAALKPGDKAPDFTLDAALAGKAFRFSLRDALRQGPVVLYFFPAAFTSGCTLEAHLFAEATPQFRQQGASVIGVSHDDIETMKRFSVSECRNQFAVGADVDRRVSQAYDVVGKRNPAYADRSSYLIVPDGTVVFHYSDSNPELHVSRTMGALKAWLARKP
jgi:thioredoxin-dependent peroxiredoxin